MNVFVLTTGRSGSTTFIRACSHITNFSAGHESRASLIGPERLRYPDNHIEADNRLSWFLGRLDQEYGASAFYVHLRRDQDLVAKSYAKRDRSGIMRAYRFNIYLDVHATVPPEALAQDLVVTATANVTHFLKDKPNRMEFRLDNADVDFEAFWDAIGAEGRLDDAIAEFARSHNATPATRWEGGAKYAARRLVRKCSRVVRGLPDFVRYT